MTAPRNKNQTIIIGTDPVLAILCVFWWRLFRPNAKIIHWCHDIYPDAAIADGLLKRSDWTVKLLNLLLRHAYRRCNVIADLGSCMRELSQKIADDIRSSDNSTATCTADTSKNEVKPNVLCRCNVINEKETIRNRTYITMPPWSLVESGTVSGPCPDVRRQLFGESSLALLYSGNLGRAHQFESFVDLARRLKDEASFCFAGRGTQFDIVNALAKAGSLRNIRLAGFAEESELRKRLSAADIHLVSLTPSWTGSVLPSKFFGSLAMGRPVLFAGDERCALAKWIKRFDIGWVLSDRNRTEIAESIREFAALSDTERAVMNQRCLDVYTEHFSKDSQLAQWRSLIRC